MNASERITNYVKELADSRGKTLARLRKLIGDAAPELVEEWKWNTPVWSLDGNVLAIGAFEDHVKINFFKGASLTESHGLFNAGLEAKASRAIDLREGDRIDEAALKALAIRPGFDITRHPLSLLSNGQLGWIQIATSW